MRPNIQLHEPGKMLVGVIAIVVISLLAALTPFEPSGTVTVDDLAATGVGTASQPATSGAATTGSATTSVPLPGTTGGPATAPATTGPSVSSGSSATSSSGVATSSGASGVTTSTSNDGTTSADTTAEPGGDAGDGDTAPPPDAGNGGAPPPATGPLVTDNGGETYQGVTAESVLMGFSAQENGCGGFNQNETAAAFGINANPRVAYEVAQEYVNNFFFEDFSLPPDIAANVNAENGYWGRRLTSVFRDSGGFACQDVGRANAVRMAEEDRVFGLIQRGNEGPEVPMSLVMAQHQLIHIGRHLTTNTFQAQRAPYFFDGYWGTGEIQNIGLGSWICRDWKDTNATDTGDPLVSGMPRKFGITHPEGANFTDAVAALTRELDACGVPYTDYEYPADVASAAANIETVVSRMRSDGITTLLNADPFIFILLMSQAADKQTYFPEWVRSGFSDGSRPHFYTTFMTETQARNAFAAADAASPNLPTYFESEAYLAWKKVRPNEEPVGDWESYYFQFKTLAIGLAGAGPNLNPATFFEGLQRLCNPCERADPLLPLETYQPGKPTNLDGFTLVKWNPDKPCPICPPNGQGEQPRGYFDFLEDGRRYGRRITDTNG